MLAVLLVLGLGLRLVGLGDSPLEFHPTRQYRSAVITRSYLLADTRPADDQERLAMEAAVEQMEDLEPPIRERMTAMIYRLTGEHLGIGRLLGIGAWLGAAVGCWSILGRLRGPIAQVVGTSFVLVLPMGVASSRSLQPDALMVALAVGSMALSLRGNDDSRVRWWLGAVALGAAAVLVKPLIAPAVVGWWVAAIVTRHGWSALRRPATLAGAVALVLPTVAYHVPRIGDQGSTGDWMSGSFVPSMLVDIDAYITGWNTVDRAVPMLLLALAVLAAAAAHGRARTLLAGAAAGHLVASAAVNYRAATHDYYHLLLVVLVALALGIGAADGAAWLRRAELGSPVRRAAAVLAASALVLAVASMASGWGTVEAEVGSGARHEEANRRIGELTGHSRSVLGVTHAYGGDLAYDAQVVAVEYPSPADAALLRSQGATVPSPGDIIATSDAEWFAVTNVPTYEALPDLQAELSAEHVLVAEGEGWLLWRLRSGR